MTVLRRYRRWKYSRPHTQSPVVAWGWRPGDIQLTSDEDWERQARVALSWYHHTKALEAQARMAEFMRATTKYAAEVGKSMRRLAEAAGRAGEALARAVVEAQAEAGDARAAAQQARAHELLRPENR